MKKLTMGLAIAVGVISLSMFGFQKEAKADYETLHGVADIIFASGTLLNGGYHNSYSVSYDHYPVYSDHHYYPTRHYRYYRHHYPRYRHHRYYHHY